LPLIIRNRFIILNALFALKAERGALDAANPNPTSIEAVAEAKAGGAAASNSQISGISADKALGFGGWRYPQRSNTAYVRCVFEALHYMLKRRGVAELQASVVSHISVLCLLC
jgi:hypothetical protein